MKFNFLQKKGVVVALAAALSVGSFAVTAFANPTIIPNSANAQSQSTSVPAQKPGGGSSGSGNTGGGSTGGAGGRRCCNPRQG